MTRAFKWHSNSRLSFLDILILKYYDQKRQRGMAVVARNLVRRYALLDLAAQPGPLKRLAPTIPVLNRDPAYVKEACLEADELPAQRKDGTVTSSWAKRVATQMSETGEIFHISMSPYEVLLLEFFQEIFGATTREQALFLIIRQFARGDHGLNTRSFRQLGKTLAEQYEGDERAKHLAAVETFLKVRRKLHRKPAA